MLSLNLLRNVVIVALILVFSGVPLGAQEVVEYSYVVSEGTGTVYVTPTHVRFWLHKELSNGDLKEGLSAVAPLDVAMREYLNGREIRPSSLEVFAPAVTSLAEGRSRVAVELRFSMAGMVGGETGPARFADLCEQMRAFGGAFLASVSEPELVVAEKNVAIRDAVEEATRQAFVAGSGAANALGGSIRSVEQVKVDDISWNGPPDTQADYPNIEVIACTARVTVTYIVQ